MKKFKKSKIKNKKQKFKNSKIQKCNNTIIQKYKNIKHLLSFDEFFNLFMLIY
jgi:hypothetical protein